MKHKIKTTLKGFTLVELMMGIALFTLLLGGIFGVLIFGIQLQRKSLVRQEISGQLSFSMEYMSRALRMAIRDEKGACLSSSDLNYENPGGNDSIIRFVNHLQGNDCQEFFLDGHTLKYKKGIGALEQLFDFSSPQLNVRNLEFYIIGQSSTDSFQPRVTISLDVNADELSSPLHLQTTISQRNLDKP